MSPHEEIISRLSSQGYWVRQREGSMANTIMASRGVTRQGELDALDGLFYLTWADPSWVLYAPIVTPGGVSELGIPTEDVCQRVITYLETPSDQLMEAFHKTRKAAGSPALEFQWPEKLPI